MQCVMLQPRGAVRVSDLRLPYPLPVCPIWQCAEPISERSQKCTAPLLNVLHVCPFVPWQWAKPTLERSPEVYYVWERMQETGCDLFIDVHGASARPMLRNTAHAYSAARLSAWESEGQTCRCTACVR